MFSFRATPRAFPPPGHFRIVIGRPTIQWLKYNAPHAKSLPSCTGEHRFGSACFRRRL